VARQFVGTAEPPVLAGTIAPSSSTGKRLDLARHWRHYSIVGILNSAAPFVLFAWSALHLPASYLVVVNATAPLFGAIVAAAWFGERITARKALGLAAGLAGVATLVGLGPFAATPTTVAAAVAGLTAALSYALASGYVKRRSYAVDSTALAGPATSRPRQCSPFGPRRRRGRPPRRGLGSGGARRGLYRRRLPALLPAHRRRWAGARAAHVTFLIPVFDALGALFLGEAITATMLVGGALVLVGTGLILGSAVRRSAPTGIGARVRR
jgi:drug/metabolite transporter (DMT)-like permease